ncbi:MAG: TlpA family protein disulfide reductase [Nitrospirae bacterium]|nr:TlpA family protein disulfide reductase [Nitrospirota bacterium]
MKSKKLILIILFLAGLFLIASFITGRGTKERLTIAAVDSPSPDIELIDSASGKKVSTSELRGKVLFINFWATWCEPCQEEAPSIDRLFRHFLNEQGFVMLTVLFRDDAQNAIGYLKQNGFNFPIMIDPDGKAARDFGLTGVPETYIVDKKGILREKVIGPAPWDSADAVALISKLLKE